MLGTDARHDALDKVTGAARYGADFHLPGMLHGKISSSYAHARIHSIDTSKAAALPGVRAVATAQDFPSWRTASSILPSCRGMRA